MLLNALDQSSLVAKSQLDFPKIFFLLLNQNAEPVDFFIEDFDLNKQNGTLSSVNVVPLTLSYNS